MISKNLLVDTAQCHLWTDALHLRQLARDARNKWDRGTYVRMCVMAAWTTLETSCQDALSDNRIGFSFKQNLDAAITNARLPELDWSRGIWQKARDLQELRKTYVHRYLAQDNLFPEAQVANEALKTVRDAVNSIYVHASKPSPPWILHDDSHGWQSKGTFQSAFVSVARNGASFDDPNTVKIFIVIGQDEHLTTVLPADTDPTEYIEDLKQSVKIPFNGIKAYNHDMLTHTITVNIRGNQ